MKTLLNKCRIMEVVIDNRDQCFNCQNSRLCPLIKYIRNDVLTLRFRSIDVKNCGLYIKGDKCQKSK